MDREYRPAGDSDDDDSEFDDHGDFNPESDRESGYDEPTLSAASISISISETLQDAMSKCLLEKIEELVPQIEKYETFQLRNNFKPLQFAASLGKPELVEYFLKVDADHDVSNLDLNPAPLTLACSVQNEEVDEDHLKCAQLLIEAGADVNSKDLYGVTALMNACKSGTLNAVRLLLVSGAQVDDRDNDGWSPIFYATNRGEKEIVQELLKYNAKFDVMDKQNRYAHSIAVDKELTDIADLIKPEIVARAEEASLNMVTVRGTTTLSDYMKEDEPQYLDYAFEMLLGVGTDMERYAPRFRDKKVNLRQFLLLKKEEDLKDIGVPLSWHRLTILHRIQQFHLSPWQPTSLGLRKREEVNHRKPEDMMELLRYMSSIRQHIYVLKTSLEYYSDDLIKFVPDNPDLVSSLKKTQLLTGTIIQRVKRLQKQIQTVTKANLPFLLAQHVYE